MKHLPWTRGMTTGVAVVVAVLAVAVFIFVSVTRDNDQAGAHVGPTPYGTWWTQPMTTPAPGAALREISTPGTLVDDMGLIPDTCHLRVVDAAAGAVLPDAACTPGAIDPAVTQDNIDETICRSGYTDTVRPSSGVTGDFKAVSYRAYGLFPADTVELDHLVPLELGGASSASNLFVEPNDADAASVNNPKDTVENALNAAVCAHRVGLSAAQMAIATNWITAEQSLGLE